MTLYKWIIAYIKKYSFVTEVIMKDAIVYIYYKNKNKISYKKIPYRANKNQLLKMINSIKKEIDYQSNKPQHILENIKERKEASLIFASSEIKNE